MITGVEGVAFGVDDLESCKQFLIDWGLSDSGSTPASLRFLGRDGSEVIVRKADDAILPPRNAEPPALREVIWGVKDEAALAALKQRFGSDAKSDSQGRLAISDVDGLTHAFQVSRRTPMQAAGQEVNGVGRPRRIDRRSPVYERATPIGLGHVVLWASDVEASANFFKEKFGFVVTDRFKGFGIFMRASTRGPHHHLFLQNRPGMPGVDHVAFNVDNWFEVLGGGLAMERKGYVTRLGPGFHPVSSAFYWYFQSPLGAALEYYTDDDYCTENWQPETFDISMKYYADWAVKGLHKPPVSPPVPGSTRG